MDARLRALRTRLLACDKVPSEQKSALPVLRNANKALQYTHPDREPEITIMRLRKPVGRHSVIRGNLMRKLQLFLCAALVSLVSGGIASAQQSWTTWHDYLGSPESAHYSSLKQINTHNIDKLNFA